MSAVNSLGRMAKGSKRLESGPAKALQVRLVALMKEHNFTSQNAFANWLGVSQPQLSVVMSGERSVGINVLLRLRQRLNVPLDDLLGLPPLAGAVAPNVIRSAVLEALEMRYGKDGAPPPRQLPPAADAPPPPRSAPKLKR